MSFKFVLPVEINGTTYHLDEPSYYDYKNLVKTIIDDDPDKLNRAFENFLATYTNYSSSKTNNIVKFLLLIKLRTLILGNYVEFDVNKTRVNYDLNKVFEFFNKPTINYTTNISGTEFEFGPPTSLYVSDNIFNLVMDCLYRMDGIELSNQDKQNLPALPVMSISKNLLENISITMKIDFIDITLWPFDTSFLYFLKSIYMYNIQGLYDLEYTLRRNLNFSALDFSSVSFAECNVLYKNFEKEVTDQEKRNSIDNNKGPII
jgi:hypothetical protein